MKISFTEPKTLPKADALVVAVAGDKKLSPYAAMLDKQADGLIARALASAKFSAKKSQYLALAAPAGVFAKTIILAGVGAPKELDALAFEHLGGGAVPFLNAAGAASAVFVLEPLKGMPLPLAEAAARIGVGARLRGYRFDKYFTKQKSEDKPTLASVTVACPGAKQAAGAFDALNAVADGVFLARDLVSEPANVIYPASLAARCKELTALGVEVEVLGVAQMKKLGMGALLGVGQGSEKESQLVTMRWNGLGAKGKTAPLAFVGKGVTFDTGGISIKPAAGMEEMKWDMGGAGAVIGLMRALAGRKARVNAVGVVGLVENMPSGSAQRPGDVVTSMSGQTIEVLNTDAEGRLVLADALWYAQERFKPQLVIDLATLTGAIIVSLGSNRAGLFSNDDQLAGRLFETGRKTGEEVWRLPLAEIYDKMLDSDIADMQNIGKEREAGSITAAQFLKRFIRDGVPWAHLDIAGVAWSKKDAPACPKGATAYGVRLLNALVEEYYEYKDRTR